jgi:hypothetical protein
MTVEGVGRYCYLWRAMSDSPRPLDDRLEVRRLDQQYLTMRTAIRGACWVGTAYFGFGAIGQFAGRSTDVDLALSLVITTLVEVKVMIAIVMTGAACAWAVIERTLRHRTIEKFQGRIRQLETAIDPQRSTSSLTPKGKTNPADRRS